MLTFTSCDTVDDKEKIINVSCETHYINTTESWSINTHNGYRAIDFNKDYDKDNDTYTVTLVFTKLGGAKWVD